MGFAFAAGTTDGPGAPTFAQGDRSGNPFWRGVRDLLRRPSRAQEACHAPKPIVLDAGEMDVPYAWAPRIVDVSLLRLGNVVIACAPGEMTTMAGRRAREAIAEAVGGAWGPGLKVVIAGFTNTYASYVTTPEEYAVQRYEGGSTLFGPLTLPAYLQTFTDLASALVREADADAAGGGATAGASGGGPAGAASSSAAAAAEQRQREQQHEQPRETPPPDLSRSQISLLAPPGFDAVPPGASFGDVVADAAGAYGPGDVVEVAFR